MNIKDNRTILGVATFAITMLFAISMSPAYAQVIGVQHVIQSGFSETAEEQISCGIGVCFAEMISDTNTGIAEIIYGTSGNMCKVTSTLTINGVSTVLFTNVLIQAIQTQTRITIGKLGKLHL